MNRFKIFRHFLVLVCLISFTVHLHAEEIPTQLPESLGKWYKPQNKRQVWLHTMFAMRRELQAVEEYTEQGDLERVKKWSDRLLKHYRSLAEMVPEWMDEIESGYADDLEQAVENNSPHEVKKLARKLGRSCKGCHIDFRIAATLRYRTADFNRIKIADANDEISHRKFKDRLTRELNRVKIAIEDRVWTSAAGAIEQLESEFILLGKICDSCHKDDDQPRERILGDSTVELMQQLKKAVADENVKMAGRHLGGAAVNVCARCHGIHRTLSEIRRDLFGDQLR